MASTPPWTGRSTRSPTGPTSARRRGARRLDRPAGAVAAAGRRGRAAGRSGWSCCPAGGAAGSPGAAPAPAAAARFVGRARPSSGWSAPCRAAARAGAPVASPAPPALAYDEVRPGPGRAPRPARPSTRQIAADPLPDAPADLLTGLRGKDVLIVFVESYGRVAVRVGVLTRRRRGARRRHPTARRRPDSVPQRASSPRPRSARSAGWRTPPCSPGCGSTASGATTS